MAERAKEMKNETSEQSPPSAPEPRHADPDERIAVIRLRRFEDRDIDFLLVQLKSLSVSLRETQQQLEISARDCERRLEWLQALGIWRERAETLEATLKAAQERCQAEMCACGHFECKHTEEHRGLWGCFHCDCKQFREAALGSSPADKS